MTEKKKTPKRSMPTFKDPEAEKLLEEIRKVPIDVALAFVLRSEGVSAESFKSIKGMLK